MRWIPMIALLACKPQLAPPDTDDVPTETDDTDVPTVLPTPPTPEPLTDPEVAGPNSFNLRIEEVDVGTELPVRLRIHEPSTADTRVALILTGFSLAPDLYDSYAQHLASHGYVAIGVGLRTNAFVGRSQAMLAGDISTVIDWIEGQDAGVFANLDTSRVVLAGHSLGGKLSLMAALEDSRIYGVIGIDPVDANPPGVEVTPENPSVAPERMSEFDFPMVFIGEDIDQNGCAPQGENYRSYFDHATGPALRIEIEDANHTSFLDNPDCGFLCNFCQPRADDPAVTRSITKGVIYAYFEHLLRSREGARDYLITMPVHNDADRVSLNVRNGF